MQRYRIAITGCGSIGKVSARAYSALPYHYTSLRFEAGVVAVTTAHRLEFHDNKRPATPVGGERGWAHLVDCLQHSVTASSSVRPMPRSEIAAILRRRVAAPCEASDAQGCR